jgi:ribosomal protein S18 acetylase RimI-like enzyme
LCTFENARSWWIQSVYVDKAYRKQGIFTSLFKYLIKRAAESGVKTVSLYAEETNHQALQTYNKLGMYVTKENVYGYDFFYSPKGAE